MTSTITGRNIYHWGSLLVEKEVKFYTKGMAAVGVRLHSFFALLESGVAMTLCCCFLLSFAKS